MDAAKTLTPADLAESADVREEFARRTGGPLPRAMRAECAPLCFPTTFPRLFDSAPAGCGAHTPNPPSCSLTAMPSGRDFSDLHALQGRRPDQVAGTWAALRLLLLSAAAFYLLAGLGLALAALAGLFANDT